MTPYFLPGQYYEFKADISVARWRGFFMGVLLTILASLAFDCLYLIPTTQRDVRVAYEAEVERLTTSNMELREELGMLNGLIVATYHRDAKKVIDSYRSRRK